ncbi:DsbA family protein [Halocatena pleomorpha]|uniref:Disulfide bond formation protein DsbA n=1 Tax=Halocatena pleomorpha TaxID=1785090 RepID=A0A3P3R7W7_9EURY|nr:thioredoxin domain-containing protein [Halocatena pleomorpha]RRJ29561.1 disulfide bond formation protein DsbA [Halocatena pleomorpha]
MSDSKIITRRRAVLSGLATLTVGGGVYGVSTLSSDNGASTPSSDDSSSVSGELYAASGAGAFGIQLGGHPIMGTGDAPLDMYYWSEYQCPYCAQFESETLPQIIQNYVTSGVVRLIFIEYPYLGSDSMTAAVMDQCVWRQVKESDPSAYWRWHSAVFEAQGETNSGWASKANLLDISRAVGGVSADTVDQCMSANRQAIETEIESDSQQVRSLGINGTPAFVLYNRQSEKTGKLIGAQPYDRFEAAIQQVKKT